MSMRKSTKNNDDGYANDIENKFEMAEDVLDKEDLMKRVNTIEFSPLVEDEFPTDAYKSMRKAIGKLQDVVEYQNSMLKQLRRAILDEHEDVQRLHLMIAGI